MEWIKVKEKDNRLENHCLYLITDGINVIVSYYDCIGFCGFERVIGKITHWMPLPQPPKE